MRPEDGLTPSTGVSLPMRAALLVGAWIVVVLFSVSQLVVTYTAAGNPPYWQSTLRFTAIQWLPWLAFAPMIIWLARRAPLSGAGWVRHAALHLAVAVLVTLAVVALSYALRAMLGAPIQRPFRAEYLRSVHSLALVYALVVGGTHAAEALRRARVHEGQVARLQAQLAEARLAALQAQLQPHFLFNTLHGVSSLIHDDPDAAEDMLTALSDLLRMTLGRGDQREVPLRDDLGFLERYLEIHKMRLGDRLAVTIDVAPDAVDLLVPSFGLQPLVENAIRHGIAPRRAGGRLTVHAARTASRLTLSVSDDGPGLDRAADVGKGGVGLSNTRARLEQLYGNDHEFSMVNRPDGGLTVTLILPARAAVVPNVVA